MPDPPNWPKDTIEPLDDSNLRRIGTVALSFVRTAEDVQQLRSRLGGSPIAIVAKIEKPRVSERVRE